MLIISKNKGISACPEIQHAQGILLPGWLLFGFTHDDFKQFYSML